MSLTGFLRRADVKAKLAPLRPRLPRKIPVLLKAEPRSSRYSMVGTAFDYLLRFELQRRAPHAIAEQLIAESAPDSIWRPGFYRHLPMDARMMPPEEAEEMAKEEAKRARQVVDRAKAAIAAYVTMKEPDHSAQADLAGHAIRLAKLDELCRAGQLDSSFAEANLEDVEDLLALLAIVPYDALIHPQTMLLNFGFGETSSLVGGADTDLITGATLVDFKTTKASEITVDNLDQLLGYYLLARRQRQVDATFPVIDRLALYFCRHGHLWVADATTWTDNPHFSEVEEWFFNRAKEEFKRVATA
jgi:hypothetical protein